MIVILTYLYHTNKLRKNKFTEVNSDKNDGYAEPKSLKAIKRENAIKMKEYTEGRTSQPENLQKKQCGGVYF